MVCATSLALAITTAAHSSACAIGKKDRDPPQGTGRWVGPGKDDFDPVLILPIFFFVVMFTANLFFLARFCCATKAVLPWSATSTLDNVATVSDERPVGQSASTLAAARAARWDRHPATVDVKYHVSRGALFCNLVPAIMLSIVVIVRSVHAPTEDIQWVYLPNERDNANGCLLGTILPSAFFGLSYGLYLVMNICCTKEAKQIGNVEDWDAVAAKLDTMRAGAPKMTLHVRCWHMEQHGSGKNRRNVAVTTFTGQCPVPFSNWVDSTSTTDHLRALKFMKVDIVSEWQAGDAATQQYITAMKNGFHAMHAHRDRNCYVWEEMTLPGFESISAALRRAHRIACENAGRGPGGKAGTPDAVVTGRLPTARWSGSAVNGRKPPLVDACSFKLATMALAAWAYRMYLEKISANVTIRCAKTVWAQQAYNPAMLDAATSTPGHIDGRPMVAHELEALRKLRQEAAQDVPAGAGAAAGRPVAGVGAAPSAPPTIATFEELLEES